jgi:kynurenine formamidase
VIDVRPRVERDHDAAVTPDDVLEWERRHGRLPDRCAVFALTGWGSRAHERPGVRALGLDTSSLDIGASADFPAHVSWLPSGRYGIENLANLDRLPPLGAVAIVGVPALAGGSGGPSRVLAIIGRRLSQAPEIPATARAGSPRWRRSRRATPDVPGR